MNGAGFSFWPSNSHSSSRCSGYVAGYSSVRCGPSVTQASGQMPPTERKMPPTSSRLRPGYCPVSHKLTRTYPRILSPDNGRCAGNDICAIQSVAPMLAHYTCRLVAEGSPEPGSLSPYGYATEHFGTAHWVHRDLPSTPVRWGQFPRRNPRAVPCNAGSARSGPHLRRRAGAAACGAAAFVDSGGVPISSSRRPLVRAQCGSIPECRRVTGALPRTLALRLAPTRPTTSRIRPDTQPPSPPVSQRYRAERLDCSCVVSLLEPDVGLLRHRARCHANRLHGRSEIQIRHD